MAQEEAPRLKVAVIRDRDGGTEVLPFTLKDRVNIDGGNVAATVIGIAIYPHDTQYQVSWWNVGELRSEWVSEWRLGRM